MRPTRFALMTALAVAVFSLASIFSPAVAASKPSATITKEQRQKGMEAAPGLITAAGLDCKLADARFIGESKDPKTKTSSSFYELACAGNEGVIVDKPAAGPPAVFTCAETASPQPDGKPSNLLCALAGNLDPKVGLLPYLAKTGIACTPDKMRALGHNATTTVFEFACQGGAGYILQTSSPPRLDKPATMIPCLALPPEGNIKCELTDRAAQLAIVDRLVTQSGKPCAVKDRRYIGASPTTGAIYYEVACQDGKGYVLETAANGTYKQAIDCAAAEGIGGGCELTNARAAETQQASLYSQLAHRAGFACDVSKYAPLPANVAGKEVVELVCSNRPDGAIAVFPAAGGGASEVYDCAHSELRGYRCTFTQASAAYPKLTAELKSLGKTSCVVSNSRVVGLSADQRGYVEVACADRLPGFMIQYALNPLAAKTVLPCSEAKGIAGGCTLPGNVKS
ncbi:MAG: hypothetical protein ACYC8V_04915 [Caulobacteraceae bacterium]